MSEAVLGRMNAEWAVRRADESFLDIGSLHAAVLARTKRAKEAPKVLYSSLRTDVQDGDIKLIGKANIPASFTHWSFGQLSRAVGAPGDFLRELPPTLTSNVLNNRLAARGDKAGECKLLLDVNGSHSVRAFTGVDYARIWDSELTGRAIQLSERGWNPAPETELANGGKTRGLYASDHDVVMCLVDNDRRVFEKAPGGGLSRMVIMGNSEVGDKSFWGLRCLYSWMCANHNIWGVEGLVEFRIRHVGNARERAFEQLEVQMKEYAEASTSEDEAKIKRCMAKQLAKDKDELLDLLFGLKSLNLSRKMLTSGYELAEEHSDWYGNPLSAWGIGNGLSEAAKEIVYADERVRVERAAGKVFEMAF